MPDTVPGLYKQAIEEAAPELVGKVWRRDHLPDGLPLPYVTIFDGISDSPVLHGDAQGLGWARLVQVDLWQEMLVATDVLMMRVCNALDGLSLHTSPYGFLTNKVDNTTKVPEEEPGLDHVAITCRLMRVKVQPPAVAGREEQLVPLHLVPLQSGDHEGT